MGAFGRDHVRVAARIDPVAPAIPAGRGPIGQWLLSILRAAMLGFAPVLTVAAGAAFAFGSSPPVRHPAVHPAVGGPTTIVQVHVIADGLDAFDSDELDITAPSGTSCANATAGRVVMDTVQGPSDNGGPVTLYIGPRAEERYPEMEDNAYNLVGAGSGLARWCPGTYTGQIWYDSGTSVPPVLTTTFQFRISATKHVKPPPLPTVARHLRPVTVSPSHGRRGTTFAVRYRADTAPYNRGDVIELDGPKRSACRGGLVRVSSWPSDDRAGPVTAHIGPGAGDSFRWGTLAITASPAPDNGTGTPLHRWCTGTYKGTILYEKSTKFTVIARFQLHVAK